MLPRRRVQAPSTERTAIPSKVTCSYQDRPKRRNRASQTSEIGLCRGRLARHTRKASGHAQRVRDGRSSAADIEIWWDNSCGGLGTSFMQENHEGAAIESMRSAIRDEPPAVSLRPYKCRGASFVFEGTVTIVTPNPVELRASRSCGLRCSVLACDSLRLFASSTFSQRAGRCKKGRRR